ncbi:hypothetical protein QO004_004350 [Rhizobium mesoamericanum]|nr:hypothetical protein [Rhizobium mesoamericanum]
MIAKPDALRYLKSGELTLVLSNWYADAGPISIYYAIRTLLPLKTRVFVNFVMEIFQRQKWPERFAGSPGVRQRATVAKVLAGFLPGSHVRSR